MSPTKEQQARQPLVLAFILLKRNHPGVASNHTINQDERAASIGKRWRKRILYPHVKRDGSRMDTGDGCSRQ